LPKKKFLKIYKVILIIIETNGFLAPIWRNPRQSRGRQRFCADLDGAGEERGPAPARLSGQKSIAGACFH
jgi:hypothetical protein